jgi:hypothetical protein
LAGWYKDRDPNSGFKGREENCGVESLTKLLAVSTKAADADVVICFAGGDSSSDEMDIAGPDGVTGCCINVRSMDFNHRADCRKRLLSSTFPGAWISIIEPTAGKDY